jgi:formylglycine-generating enzyme required for sulfatase activity
MKKKNYQIVESSNSRVELKPLFGIKPRVYVAAGYGLALLVIVFFLLLYPGLSKPGAELTVTTIPEGTSVLVDGVRIGSSPVTAFIAKGGHILTLRRPCFTEAEIPLTVGGRLFGSFIFPKKEAVHAELSLASASSLLANAHREFSGWALTGEPNPLYPFPPVLSEAVRDYALAGAGDADGGKELFSLLSAAAASVNSAGNFRDFVNAGLLAASAGKALTPQSLVKAADYFLVLLGGREEAAYRLARILPAKAAEEFTGSAYWASCLSRIAEKAKAAGKPEPKSSHLQTILGREFRRIPGGNFYPGWAGISDSSVSRESPVPAVPAETETFFLQTTEVSQDEYAAFLRENPRWAPANRAALVREGLAEESYLASWKDSSAPPLPAYPVSEVSFYAAQAYCAWLGSRDERYVFSLPGEKQWEYAASLNLPPEGTSAGVEKYSTVRTAASGQEGAAGLKFMLGNLWEWCGDWYAPGSYIFPLSGDFPAGEKVVRGGAWVNSDMPVTVSTRGSQPPEWCSPYLGFRVAAAEKKTPGEPRSPQ